MSDRLTLVLQSWKKKRRNHRVLFGAPQRRVRLDWQRSVLAFRPGQIFGYERWEANKFGTLHWSIDILKSAGSGEKLCQVQGVKPGAILLANLRGKKNCKSALTAIDTLKANGNLTDISEVHWSLIGHEIQFGSMVDGTLSKLSNSLCADE